MQRIFQAVITARLRVMMTMVSQFLTCLRTILRYGPTTQIITIDLLFLFLFCRA